MIAVLNIDGRQFKVEESQELYINRISGKKGDKLTFNTVSVIKNDKSVSIGSPLVANAEIGVSIIEQTKDDKVVVFKKKRRKGYKVKNGHRQMLTKIKIDSISVGGTAKKTTAKKTTAKKTTAKK
jgi:large subunit ribosomal protein L21